ncbi:MAG TPA: diguanylate cyclase, partial [Solirubrobacteraceae bacterium]|nr:diguanylate cyclase [Solirubrobacteraceae bacterium]
MSHVASVQRIPVVMWRAAVAALFVALLVLSGNEVGLGTDPVVGQWVQAAMCVLIAGPVAVHAYRTRSAFAALLALGVGLWAFGSAWYAGFLVEAVDPPFPSPADAGYIGSAVAFYAAVMVVLRRNVAGWDAGLWLDGAVAAFVAAAVGAAIVLPTVDTGSTDALAVATNVAYPLVDVLLLGAIAGGWVLSGGRPARTWRWLTAGILVLAATDIEFLLLVASGDWVLGGIDDLGWPLALLLLSRAAFVHDEEAREPRRLDARRVPLVPFLCAAVAVGLLLFDHWLRLDPFGVVMAGIAVVLAAVRTVMALRTNVRLLDTERQALTDELTGLGNRRRLLRDLGTVETATVALFDLDGFKTYNDAYGHPAGDALLSALGARLAEATDGHGRAYRLGGDEFCVLVTASGVDHALVLDRALDALRQEGDGFSVGASYGTVRVPEEAAKPEDALQLADTRMYAQKESRRSSTRRQSRDLLLQLLHEQQPDLEEHSGDVGDLVAAVGTRLGLNEEALDHARHAAELHDVGKVAIPASILRKPGPLDEQEWVLMKRHTIIGERILAAVPALVPVGRIVRATHERWDGAGYPDGLRGEEIPLAARVIAVCDTFHAITTDRPYRAGKPAEEALAELRRCAGTQFDAAVVEAFAEELADGAACALPDRDATSEDT